MTDTHEGHSFDVRTWRTTAIEAAVAMGPSETAGGHRSTLFGGAAALLLAVLATSWTTRPAQSPRSATITPLSGPAAPATVAERSLVLPDAAALREALAADGLPADQAAAVAAAAQAHLRGTGEITALMRLDQSGAIPRLTFLKALAADGSGVAVVPAGTGWNAQALAAQLGTSFVVRRGEMNNDSLYTSAVAAGVDDGLIPDFAKAFVYDFDFQREIDAGDVFETAAEQTVDAEGRSVGPPRLVYASFTTAEKSRAVYHFNPPGGEGGWYDGNGRSVVRSLMRTPVDGARVSSTFGLRVHPVLGYTKMHNGIDFAAPVGTPIYAAGNAVVEWAAMRGTAGNAVILKHDNGWETFYFHMSAFAPGVTQGARVTQGQQIGAIGTTGRSTGPHLHYGLQIGGEWSDPSAAKTDEGHALDGAALAAFRKERDRIDAARAHYSG